MEPAAGVTSGSDRSGRRAPRRPDKPRRRGSRGGIGTASGRPAGRRRTTAPRTTPRPPPTRRRAPELPERTSESRPSAEAAERALVAQAADRRHPARAAGRAPARSRVRRRRRAGTRAQASPARRRGRGSGAQRRRRSAERRHGRRRRRDDEPVELDEETLERRRGRERKGRPVGRYLMCVHVRPHATQIAVLEGRSLIEHYVSRPQDDASQIHGNIYLGKVQNVLPGHGGGVRRHRHAQERGALPGRRAVRPRGRRSRRARRRPHRAAPAAGPDDPLPGHQEPDRHQGRPPHPGGVAARAASSSSSPTAPPTASRSASPTTSASACAASSTRSSPANHGVIVRTAAEGATADELRRDVAAPAAVSGSRSRPWPSGRSRPRCSTASPTSRCG